jgi:DNA-binding NarL/FixJ family response regulator
VIPPALRPGYIVSVIEAGTQLSVAAPELSAVSDFMASVMITVGIVEDNRELRASLTRMVDAAPGYRCVCACASAEEALRELPRAMPQVVLMDIHLPMRSGIECTRHLKDLCPGMQVLILTVYKDDDSIFNALKAGASGYLLKRSSPDEILRAVTEVREGGSPMSTQIARKVVSSFREPATEPQAEEQSLSEREAEVLGYMSKGYSEREISDRMHVSVNTVKSHRKHIYQKLHVRSRRDILLRFRP